MFVVDDDADDDDDAELVMEKFINFYFIRECTNYT